MLPLRRLLRVLLWIATLAYFAFALLVLVLRYAVLPQIESYRPDLERMLGSAINRPVGIRKIEAHWAGLRPALRLDGFEIRDAEGRPALGFDEVDTELAWSSLWHLELRLARLELNAPNLQLRRDAQGRFFAAGLEITPQTGDEDGFADWLLAQDRVVIRDASIAWTDELRGAPTLELKRLNFQLDNSGNRHRFGLTAEPPRKLAARIDLRGDFKGRDIDQLNAWKGEAYAELDYADLAVWRAWVDYPVALPQGKGALRLWLGFAGKQLASATADVRLADVRLRLRRDLPELDLMLLEGRLAGRRLENGFEAELKRLSLSTRDGLTLPETDFKLSWRGAAANRPGQGSATANGLDLGVMAGLAAHLPFDEGSRARLARHAPRGKVFDLKLEWTASAAGLAALQKWSVSSRFEGLGLSALGPVPGMAGVNGRVDGNEKGGTLVLDGQKAVFELPTIFADPKLELEAFAAEADWRLANDGLQVRLQKAAFHNRDAAGEASGTWRPLEKGPGQIDMQARITRGSGDAVWRYMPLVVGKNVREWLREAIIGGKASDATLKLRGDLWNFPFRDGKDGIFEVRGKFQDANLRYADAWPEIKQIDGELLFSGQRMLITGKRGSIFGVKLRDVKAEIADLEQHDELLTISGKAAGATADFLRFIEASPVAERIDRFTEDMRAEGNGELDLKLALPLRNLARSKIDGSYRFDGNRLVVDSDLPPLTEVRGALRFSGDHLEARGIRGNLLAMPLSVDIRTGEGGVQVNASGEASVATLRRELPHPVFEHLTGGAKWNGTVRVRKKAAEVKLSSNLVGLSSSLPEPFNKPATEAMNLTFERKPPPEPAARPGARPAAAVRTPPARDAGPASVAAPPLPQDMLDIALGRNVRLQLVRRHEKDRAVITRGLVAIGDTGASLPERNLNLAINLPRIDTDFWRGLMDDKGNARNASALPPLPGIQFDLRAGEAIAQEKSFHDVRISGSRAEGATATRFELKSREVTGSFDWNSAGGGKLTGRIGQFAIPETAASPAVLQARTTEVIDRIPALDITVDQLSFKERALGTVRVAAENREGYWTTRVDVKNDDGALEANGRWRRHTSQADTRVEFKLEAKNLDKLLARIGYPDTVRRGSASLAGNLSWNGTPFTIDYPSLAGNLKLEAAGGQFVKLEPGVGRLLGILSLQSLPRRITLDFRDVFSEGFAFDAIGGQFAVARGVMSTGDLQIRGPSAKVLMSGNVNLGAETQDLKVRVQPAVGESIAVGTMIANPVAGAVVWAAQKLFKDPLDQAFAFEYGVTGSWADPKVEKLSQVPAKPAEESK